MRLLVIGYGYLGESLTRLAEAHHPQVAVTGVRRTPLPAHHSADVSDRASLRSVRERYGVPEALVYAVSPRSGGPKGYERAYGEGVTNVLEVWPETRFVLISSTAVYGACSEATIDDATPICPTSEREHALARGEDLVLGASATNLVLRPSGIYGPGRTTLLTRLLEEELSAEEASRVTNRIYEADLARAVISLAAAPTTRGSYLVSDLEPVALGELQRFLRSLPVGETFRRPSELTVRRDSGRGPRRSRKLVPQRLLELGFTFEVPSFRVGYPRILKQSLRSGERDLRMR